MNMVDSILGSIMGLIIVCIWGGIALAVVSLSIGVAGAMYEYIYSTWKRLNGR